MALTTDLIHDVTNYLVTQLQSNATLAAMTPPCQVFDGPSILIGEQTTEPLWLCIGYDAISGNEAAGAARQRWPFVGQSGAYREETGSIPCCAQAWQGDPVIANTRVLCKTIVGAVENMLRGAPSTGGPGDSSMGNLVQWSQVEDFAWTQKQDDTGTGVACVFTVTYLARLAPN